ncbi:membrane hypothetical protein [Candidatus Sulfopaludibacter sp. SbA3]|nr:membrane hypothetical protein [Candidatus Sulfopaludibacter sp. SbA3]
MTEFDTTALSFRQAELRSEYTRVRVLLGVLGSLLILVLIRGIASLAEGRLGGVWRFVLALALMAGYESAWLRFVGQAIGSSGMVSDAAWKSSVLVESLLPTVALLLQIHTPLIGPQRALTSPVVLAYILLTMLSTLHLDPGLSRLSGVVSAAGYVAVAIYAFLRFPEAVAGGRFLAFGTSFSCAALLLLSGFAAGAIAHQIRLHVIAALREAESRAKTSHDLEIARSIQQGLLPKAPPRIGGFDIAGWNKPADETGGDYFDWQQLPDGHVAFTIADVTGHGIGPALCMSACRAYARAGIAAMPNLQDLLGSLNDLLCQDLPSERFVTMAVGLLNPEDATLELISAGHGPLLFYLSAEDRFRSYDAQGLPLGLMPDSRYGSPQTLKLTPGDMLIFVTDGFIEWANAEDEEFGQNRLKDLIRANRGAPSATIIAELYSAVVRFAGCMPQLDDLTAVIVKRS